jgi:hypothetical protein
VITGNIGVLVVRLIPYQLLNMPCAKDMVTRCYFVVWPPAGCELAGDKVVRTVVWWGRN